MFDNFFCDGITMGSRDIIKYVVECSGILYTIITVFIKPGARPQPAFGRLWACAWFTEIVFV